jgi:hypothetical protein
MESRSLQPLDPVLSAANSRLTLAPVAQPCAAPALDATRVQAKDLGAPAATAADELKENAAGACAKRDDANLGRNRQAIVSFERHRDTRHIWRQST